MKNTQAKKTVPAVIYRHGDVVIEALAEPPLTGAALPSRGGVTLALGEATGHSHAIRTTEAEIFLPPDVTADNDNGTRLLLLKAPADLRHEEHTTIRLPAGWYRTRIKRQYSPDGWANVAD